MNDEENDYNCAVHYNYSMAHTGRIREHYANAVKKHPYFCDCLNPTGLEELPPGISNNISFHLSAVRAIVADEAKNGTLGWDRLLNCEVWEVYEALANNNAAQAVEELYDAIAVLLRTIDVVEGRQRLGKPEDAAKKN